jgi:hypothetical protein
MNNYSIVLKRYNFHQRIKNENTLRIISTTPSLSPVAAISVVFTMNSIGRGTH